MDSLCGSRLADRLAAVQVGLIGAGIDGHSQTRMLLLSGPVLIARVCHGVNLG